MDQIKIGKFIADCRKEQGMTQDKIHEMSGVRQVELSEEGTDKGRVKRKAFHHRFYSDLLGDRPLQVLS